MTLKSFPPCLENISLTLPLVSGVEGGMGNTGAPSMMQLTQDIMRGSKLIYTNLQWSSLQASLTNWSFASSIFKPRSTFSAVLSTTCPSFSAKSDRTTLQEGLIGLSKLWSEKDVSYSRLRFLSYSSLCLTVTSK